MRAYKNEIKRISHSQYSDCILFNKATTHTLKKNHDKSRVSAHNLGQDLRGKQVGATEACFQHVAGSDNVADSLDGLKCEHLLNKKIKLLFLPGSRNFEVQALLSIFIQTISYLNSFSFELGLVPSPNVNQHLYYPYLRSMTSIFSHQKLSEALEWADISLAASGTVSLACALFRVPTVVAYKVSLLDEFFLDTFTNYKGFFSLANIIHQEKIFPEFIQESCSSYNLANALENWLTNKDIYQRVKQKLASTSNLLDGEEKIGDYMAEVILKAYDNAIPFTARVDGDMKM